MTSILTKFNFFINIIFLIAILFYFTNNAYAIERIIINPNISNNDIRNIYPNLLLQEALKRSEDKYEPFIIQQYPAALSRHRALAKIISGEISVYEAATIDEWEDKTIAIRIPLRKGIQGYRIFFIRKKDQHLFDKINKFDDLHKYNMGSGVQWSVTKAMRKLNIPVFGSVEYEPLFKMLMASRFDYFPRGINEIFSEYKNRRYKLINLAIEQNIAIYIPLPTYFFVTPKEPELAKRIRNGLLEMIEDGGFDKIFYKFHNDQIQQAKLDKRKIFRIANLNLPAMTPLDVEKYWYKP